MDGPLPAPEPSPDEGGAHRTVSRAAILLAATALLSRLLGFARDAVIAGFFGKNAITSAYLYAFQLPDTLWMLVAGGAFSAAFIPVVNGYFTRSEEAAKRGDFETARREEAGAWKTYSVITTFLFVCLSVILPLAWIFARPLIGRVIAPGFTDAEVVPGFGLVHPLTMAVQMTRIVLPAQYCFFLGTLMLSMLQARNRWLAPALGPMIYNLGIIVFGVALHRQLGIAAFSWGALAGAVIGNLLIQAWALRGLRPHFRPSLDLRFEGVRKAGKLVVPVIFGISLPQATQVVNGMFVASVASGMTVLRYANTLMQLPLGIFGQVIGMAVLPTLTAQATRNDMRAFRETLNYGIRLALFLTVPASALMIVLAQPLIAFVYQRGAFTPADTASAVPALVLFSLGVSAWSAQAVLARAYYARNDTWTPVLAGTFVTFVIFVPLCFLLTPHLDVPGTPLLTRGPALATSLASITNTLLLLYFAGRRFGGINARRLLLSLARVVLASAIMGVLCAGVYRWLAPHTGHSSLAAFAQLAVAGGAGIALFVAAAVALRCEELHELKGLFRRRG